MTCTSYSKQLIIQLEKTPLHKITGKRRRDGRWMITSTSIEDSSQIHMHMFYDTLCSKTHRRHWRIRTLIKLICNWRHFSMFSSLTEMTSQNVFFLLTKQNPSRTWTWSIPGASSFCGFWLITSPSWHLPRAWGKYFQ